MKDGVHLRPSANGPAPPDIVVQFCTQRARPANGGISLHGLTTLFGKQFRLYLREMGVDSELLDIVDRNMEEHHSTEVPASDWTRLHIVTTAPQ